jgi:hypothetical protein
MKQNETCYVMTIFFFSILAHNPASGFSDVAKKRFFTIDKHQIYFWCIFTRCCNDTYREEYVVIYIRVRKVNFPARQPSFRHDGAAECLFGWSAGADMLISFCQKEYVLAVLMEKVMF